MKNTKAIGLLAVALGIGLVAAALTAGWLAERGSIASRKVVVAAVDIELGSKVNPQMLATVDWPTGSVPPGTFSELAPLHDRVVKTTVNRGEALLERKLMPQGSQGGMSAVIAEGKRAMTVRVNDVVGVAGFALPGNYVDVLVNAQRERSKGEAAVPVSMTVLENVLVLAVAQEASRDETKPKVVSAVTLELALADAEKLDLARSIGTLSLVLRNQLDKDRAASTGISKLELFGQHDTVQAAAPPRPARAPSALRVAATPRPPQPLLACVDVIAHGQRTLSCF